MPAARGGEDELRSGAGMDDLTLAFLRIGQAVRAIGLAEAREAGFTPVQAQTLLFVRDTKSFATTVGNLARRLGATNASTVGVVDALASRGLLRREADPRDRRGTLLRLTPEGERAAARLAHWGHLLGEALAGLSPGERATLESSLGGVIWSLRAAGHLDVAEPCRGCVHFVENAAPGSDEPHRCALIQMHLSEREAMKFCPDHEPAVPSGARPSFPS